MDSPVSAKVAILQALIRDEAFGLELIERVREATDGQLVLGQGSLYPALRELERSGFISSREQLGPAERGGRQRRYYRLTAEGFGKLHESRVLVARLFGLQMERSQ